MPLEPSTPREVRRLHCGMYFQSSWRGPARASPGTVRFGSQLRRPGVQEDGHACGTSSPGLRHWGSALCVAPVATGRGAGVDLLGAMLTYDTEDCLARLDSAKAPLLEILCSNAADISFERLNDIPAGARF